MDNKIEALKKENETLRKQLEQLEAKSKQHDKQKKSALKFLGHVLAGKRLKSSIYIVIDQYETQRHVTKDAISELLASMVHRITRISIFTFIFALLPSILLIQQNVLLNRQNKKIDDQNFLAEASRRSGQMFIMGEVLSDINSELNKRSSLSDVLVGRIISLSRAMKPYNYYEDGVLIEKPMSPERGQLLVTISKSGISRTQLSDGIFQVSDFSYADLESAKLHGAYLSDIYLDYANLSNAELKGVSLFDASLKHAILYNADLTDANLQLANFSNADLSDANLRYAELEDTNFTNAILDNVKVDRANWIEHIKDSLKLKGAETIYKTYTIDSVYAEDLGKKVPTLVKKTGLF